MSRDNTRTRLLAATEKILVERGVNALSVRRVGEGAGQNPALVTYYFKGIGNLLDELCTLNLEPMLGAWRAIEPGRGLGIEDVLHLWLEPMLAPAAFTPGGRALTVLDEIAAHGEAALRERVLGAMQAFTRRLRATLAPLLPHLSERELRARTRFISGAALGPPPRTYASQPTEEGMGPDEIRYLLPFAWAALELPRRD